MLSEAVTTWTFIDIESQNFSGQKSNYSTNIEMALCTVIKGRKEGRKQERVAVTQHTAIINLMSNLLPPPPDFERINC